MNLIKIVKINPKCGRTMTLINKNFLIKKARLTKVKTT